MWNGSKVLITGGTGMVARHIKDFLESNYDVSIESPDRNVLNLENSNEVHEYFSKFNPDYVFHLAGKVYGLGGNLLYPMETLSSNVLINDSVLTACSQDSVKKIFFAGTVASYEYPFSNLPLSEDRIFYGEPHSGEYGYAMAKRFAFSYLKLLQEKFGKKFIYGIYTNLYGPHDRFNITSGHVVPSLVFKLDIAIKNKTDLHVWGRPDTIRDFLYVEDAAAAAIFLMEQGEGIFNIASGKEKSMQEVIDSLLKASKFNGDVIWDESKPVGIPKRFSNIQRLSELGFYSKNELPDGIAKTWHWYSEALIQNQSIRG
jgi:GDP-L-fucose synthase